MYCSFRHPNRDGIAGDGDWLGLDVLGDAGFCRSVNKNVLI